VLDEATLLFFPGNVRQSKSVSLVGSFMKVLEGLGPRML